MSALTIHGVTVTCDFGDKDYGKGLGRFMSLKSAIPDGEPGVPLTDLGSVMQDGLDMYFTAWATLLQTRYATGDLNAEQFKEQLASYRVRVELIHKLFKKIEGKSLEELMAFLDQKREENNGTA